jgi:hypothetical protein
MDKITITFEAVQQPKFKVWLNAQEVSYQIEDQTLTIDTEVVFGLNLLKLEINDLEDNIKVVIKDLVLNSVSSRQTLYLAHYENPQACGTWITANRPELIIPFGNPMSWWISECGKKIPNNLYGTNLYEKFDIFYPPQVIIDESFPQLMKDFMKYNFGFHIRNKDNPQWQDTTLPWIKISLDYDESALFDEFTANMDLLKNNYYTPKQNQYNEKESVTKPWHVAIAIHDNHTEEFNETDFPLFFKLMHQIESQGIKILHAFIGTVHPNSYVAPHADDFYKTTADYQNAVGCSSIYIPIGWKLGNHFKFENVGLLPYEQGAYLVNNSDFIHGSINASDTPRYTIGVYCLVSNQNITELSTKNIV